MHIEGNTFLVTGGASGLGAATARMVVAHGGNAVIADVDGARGAEIAAQLGETRCLFVQTDVTDESSVKACIAASVDRFRALRGAVNCAGIVFGERVVGKGHPHALASFKRVIEINLIGTFNVLRLAAHAMSQLEPLSSGERGVIINTSSVSAFEGQIGQAAYSASKAGINGMTLPIARELTKVAIRVVTVAPGVFDTALLQDVSETIVASLAQQVLFPPRFGKPEEYAALVKHIVENEYMNGSVVRLDGAVRMGAR